MKTIIKSDIVSALKSVGLQNGDSVMVHTSLGQIGKERSWNMFM